MKMKIGIIGLGLIGGSLGRALVKNTKHRIYAYDADRETMAQGISLNAYHEQLDVTNVAKLDLLIIALYPKLTIDCLSQYVPLMKAGSTVIDCAGIKKEIVEKMHELKVAHPEINFIGCHPMAGREFSGIKHSTAGLFENASILFVLVNTPDKVFASVKELFLQAGAERVVVTTAEEHDKRIAYTSQLAHVVSSAYVNNENATKHYGFTAGSFRDMTRVAKLNPDMWSELMIENSDYLTVELDTLIENLKDFQKVISTKDKVGLHSLLDKGNRIKVEIESNKGKKLEALEDVEVIKPT